MVRFIRSGADVQINVLPPGTDLEHPDIKPAPVERPEPIEINPVPVYEPSTSDAAPKPAPAPSKADVQFPESGAEWEEKAKATAAKAEKKGKAIEKDIEKKGKDLKKKAKVGRRGGIEGVD